MKDLKKFSIPAGSYNYRIVLRIGTTVADGWGKCESEAEARRMFDNLRQTVNGVKHGELFYNGEKIEKR